MKIKKIKLFIEIKNIGRLEKEWDIKEALESFGCPPEEVDRILSLKGKKQTEAIEDAIDAFFEFEPLSYFYDIE